MNTEEALCLAREALAELEEAARAVQAREWDRASIEVERGKARVAIAAIDAARAQPSVPLSAQPVATRDAFEAWAATLGLTDMWLERDDAGEYTFARCKDAWLGWQAATEHTLQGVKGQVQQMLAAQRELSDGEIEYRLGASSGQMAWVNFPAATPPPPADARGSEALREALAAHFARQPKLMAMRPTHT